MNEQNTDSSLTENTKSAQAVPQSFGIIIQKRAGLFGALKKIGRRKESNIGEKMINVISSGGVLSSENQPLDLSPDFTQPRIVMPSEISDSHTIRAPVMERMRHLFHKKIPNSVSTSPILENPTDISMPDQSVISTLLTLTEKTGISQEVDDRFTRILEQDKTYRSMIRSEDVQNIQLQLSMRYMLLLFAIFVVIVWVINNRVIMFGFSDFPFLARTRDTLFVLLTGLFSLTVWFGSSVWFRHTLLRKIVRVFAITLFSAVLISVYLPFWR